MRRRAPVDPQVELNITSMADVLTILLVFLLKSFATTSISPPAGLMLPDAEASAPPIEALKVEIAESAVLVEGQPVASLENFRMRDPSRLAGAFEAARARQDAIAKVNSDVSGDSRLVVVADRRVPYSTLQSVIVAAGAHGYVDLKLAVVGK